MNRPVTTLFMLMSVDGKISTGATDELDVDRDFPKITGLREKLFDFVDLVVAPVLIGGKDTATLIDGQSLCSASELSRLGVLRLIGVTPLQDSFLRLRYQVIG
ncbi:MAG: hypothetical protein II888_07070 [Clostridia bacterium]|nr:hypothetical protein [Clostridia bacterium]